MNPNYKPLHQQAEKLHISFLDMRDDRDTQLNKWLEHETREIREDMEKSKSPRTIETRVQGVIKQLQQAKSQPNPAISGNDAETLFNSYEKLRQQLRSLPNY